MVAVLKLLKMKDLVEKHEDNEVIARFMGSVTVVKLFIQLLYMCHFLACFFYLFGDITTSDRPDGTVLYGWVYRQQWGAYGWTGRYLYSFFLSITDETSGYAETDAELMWTGTQHILYEAFMAYLTGVFAGEVISGNAAQQKYTEKMDQVKHYMHHYGLKYDLKQQVYAFYTHLNSTKTFFDEKAVLNEFPPAIRKQVIQHIYSTIVDNRLVQIHYPFLSRLPERLRYELCLVLKPLPAVRGDVIYTEGEYGDEMYLVDKGSCQAYKWTGDTKEDHKRKLEERNKTIYATGLLEEGLTLHVRGIGGPTAEPGVYESAEALRLIFEEFGEFGDAVVRHRVDKGSGKNTSWALVTMGDAESAQRALDAGAAGGVLRPDGLALKVTPYSKGTAATSTGAMKATSDAVLTMDARAEDHIAEDHQEAHEYEAQHHPKYGDRIGQYNDGSFFGEEALLGDNIKRIATVVAVAMNCHIWYLDRATFSSFSRQEDVALFYKELRSFARKRQRLNDLRAKRVAQLDSRLVALKRQFSITHLLAGGLPANARIPTTTELPMIDHAFSPSTLGDVRDAVKFRCVALDFKHKESVQSAEEGGMGGLSGGVFVLLRGELKASIADNFSSAAVDVMSATKAKQEGLARGRANWGRLRAHQKMQTRWRVLKPGTVFSAVGSVRKVRELAPAPEDGKPGEVIGHPAGVHVREAVVASEGASALWLDGRLFDFAHDPNSLEVTLGEEDAADDVRSHATKKVYDRTFFSEIDCM